MEGSLGHVPSTVVDLCRVSRVVPMPDQALAGAGHVHACLDGTHYMGPAYGRCPTPFQ